MVGTANPPGTPRRLSLEKEAPAGVPQASGWGAHSPHLPAEAAGALGDWGCPWLGRGSRRGFLEVEERKKDKLSKSHHLSPNP